jgi:hypothetical protein
MLRAAIKAAKHPAAISAATKRCAADIRAGCHRAGGRAVMSGVDGEVISISSRFYTSRAASPNPWKFRSFLISADCSREMAGVLAELI